MNRYKAEAIFGAVLLALWLVLAHWQAPGSPLSEQEIESAIRKIETAPIPTPQKDAMVRHLRAWGAADDGKPVQMLNLMRFKKTVEPWPGTSVEPGTPEDINARYESAALGVALPKGLSMSFAGAGQTTSGESTSLWGHEAGLDHWDRVLVVRYPSRRAFFELLSDPEYLSFMHWKFAAVELSLVPMSEITRTPDLRLMAGAVFLTLFLAFGWIRALRQH